MSANARATDDRLPHLQWRRTVILASLTRALATWKISRTARAFAFEQLDRLLNDDELRALLTEADSVGVHPSCVLSDRLVREVICMWLLVGRGFDAPERLAATVRGIVPMPQLH
jgi:hypothetical protein